MKISVQERIYIIVLFVIALLMGTANNLLQEKPLNWFDSPKVLEKPPELKEGES